MYFSKSRIVVQDEANDPINENKSDDDDGVDHLGNKLNNLKKKGKFFKHFTSNLFIVSDINPESLKNFTSSFFSSESLASS